MKDKFAGFHKPDDEDIKQMWAECLFVLDTNVLLNLYKYREVTRDALVEVLETLSPRVWITYHVALEFQRSRTTVLAQQHKKFAEVRAETENLTNSLKNKFGQLQIDKLHSLIDPSDFLNEH